MLEYQPMILPEVLPPAEITACNKCELHKQRKRVIWGEGNPAAPIFIVLDNPGAREDKNGQEFLCGTRETLQKAAYEVGLKPSDFYISYILKCSPIRKYDKPLCRNLCLPYLWDQIAKSKPSTILSLGNIATQILFGESDVEVKNLRGNIHYVNDYKTVVSYHPLAVRRRPNLYDLFIEDWNLLIANTKYQY